MEIRETPAPALETSPSSRSATAARVGWAAAYLLYLLAFATSFGIALGLSPLRSLLVALANTLPEGIGAPVILRQASRGDASSARTRVRLALLGAAYIVWCALGTLAAFAAWRAVESGTWRVLPDLRNVAWKCLFSLLVFGALAGVGRARFHARRATEAAERAHRAETLRLEARLSILRAQLNPHFILNVLHSLVGLARRDPDATSSALERLGTTLRYALRVQNRRCDRVTLRDELAFTLEYLELERLRLGERLSVRVRAQESALDRAVPPFVLQPLVENAVLHSISARARGGVISIGIGNEGAVLLVTVDDDGTPAPAAAPPRRPGSGLGLKLLRDRLDAHYEGRGTLDVGPSPLGGTRARLRLEGEPAGGGTGDAEGE